MAGITNKGKYNILDDRYRATAAPTVFYLALITSATAPTADINTFGELTEIADTQGYTAGGKSIARNSTDFDVLTEDDGNDRALIQLKDQVWTASGGNLPASGDGARYAVLTDDHATPGSREIETYWDLVSDRTVSDGQTLTLTDCEIRINES